jgi:Xaa-Pro dipeptidase
MGQGQLDRRMRGESEEVIMYLSKQERDRRYEALRASMAKEDIPVLLVVGNGHATGSPAFSTGGFRYLTDFFIFSQYGVLLFFQKDDPIMLVPMELQETVARKYSWVDDIRLSLDYAETVTMVLKEKKLEKRKVGMISMESMPASMYLVLREKVPEANLVDAGPMLLRQKFVKSNDERKLLQKAAELNDGAYKEVLKKLTPGMTEYEVAGIIEGFHRGHGADKTFNLVFSGPFPASSEGIPFQGLPWCPGQRAIEKGDCVHMEMTNACGGYWNQLVRIIAVGAENSALIRFHEAAVNITRSAVESTKVGTRTADMVSRMAETSRKYGFTLTAPLGHFVGLDLIEGRVEAGSQVLFNPGIAAIIHPRIDDSRGANMLLWGETYFMTEAGFVRLNQTDDVLHTV